MKTEVSIAILYICTGKYSVFWPGFYESSEEYFLPKSRKRYFVFSDTLSGPLPDNVTLIYQEKMGWPYDTLKRFHLFNSIEARLKDFNFIFFCNANLEFKKTISEDILTNEKGDADLIVVKHPFFYWVKHPSSYPYERNKKSTAFMKKNWGFMYAFGAFNGGRSESYLKMVNELKRRIDVDLGNDIIALWHDESQLNRYIFETKENLKILECNYACPEGQSRPEVGEIYTLVLDKAAFGGHDYLRGQENSIPSIPVQKSFYPIRWLKQKIRSLL